MRARHPELPPKSFQEVGLGLLSLLLHRAEMSTRTEIDDEERVISSSPPENSTRLREPNNRRRKQRFPLDCPLRYQTLGRAGPQAAGTGRTINLSSRGTLFTTEHTLYPVEPVEISITWPVKLDHEIPLEIVSTAKVVRGQEGKAAVEILRYEFRSKAEGTRSLLSG